MRVILRMVFLIAVILLGIIGWVFGTSAGKIKKHPAEAAGEPYDFIVVLGCGVNRDGSLSAMLTYRLEKALEAYESGVAPMILVTGDHRDGEYDEPDHMAEYLIQKGVPRSVIVRDYEGYSTYESMYNTAVIMREYQAVTDIPGENKPRVALVTQKYHLFRTIYIARHFGMEVCGIPAKDWHLTPGTVYRHLRELPGILKDFMQCLVGGGI